MAYAGTTSTAPNPPLLVSQGIGSTGGATPTVWLYSSTHINSGVDGAGFFTDGLGLGMAVGDSVIVQQSTGAGTSHHVVNAVTSTGATVSAGLIVSSAS
jgi:hypothetical protein